MLTHRNICHVFDAGCFEGQYYLAMEHINGREVRAVQKLAEDHHAALPVDVAIFVVKETLEALDAAHRMTHPLTGQPLRVVHRDVSPQNVMISSEGEVKLIDFGLAESSQKLERTAPRIVMGKIAYMAPEQARGDPGLDGRADQFAAGVLLYELLSNARFYGELPFDDVWRNSGRGGFVPTKLNQIEPALAAVIAKATAANREDRYASCGDMRAALQKVELARGALAGSRETRAALQSLLELAGEALPSLSSPEIKSLPRPKAELAPTIEIAAHPPKERTRTFRVRSISSSDDGEATGVHTRIENLGAGEKTEIGFVIEGLEPQELPPALVTGDAFRPVSLMASGPSPMSSQALGASMPPPGFVSAETPSVPREPTVVVRSRPTRDANATTTPTTLPAADFPPTEKKKPPLRLIAAAAGLAVVALVAALAAGGKEEVSDAGVVVAAVVDAGTVDIVKDAGAVVDVVKDAGVVVEVVKDAGAVDIADIVEPDDAGRRTVIRKPRREGRELAALPPAKIGNMAFVGAFNRSTFLKQNCSDLPCAARQEKSLMSAGTDDAARAKVVDDQQECYERCRRKAKP